MQIEYWQIAHVFALPEKYSDVVKLVAKSSTKATESAKAELILKERGLAVYMFTLYENTWFQWEQAVRARDPRAEFYKAVLDYMSTKVLRNPRLLYWWDQGDLKDYFETGTIKYYDEHVLRDALKPLKEIPDKEGPFNLSTPRT